MSKGNKKEKWGKPKLIILTRGKPEERILTTCKTTTVWADSESQFGKCLTSTEVACPGACNTRIGT